MEKLDSHVIGVSFCRENSAEILSSTSSSWVSWRSPATSPLFCFSTDLADDQLPAVSWSWAELLASSQCLWRLSRQSRPQRFSSGSFLLPARLQSSTTIRQSFFQPLWGILQWDLDRCARVLPELSRRSSLCWIPSIRRSRRLSSELFPSFLAFGCCSYRRRMASPCQKASKTAKASAGVTLSSQLAWARSRPRTTTESRQTSKWSNSKQFSDKLFPPTAFTRTQSGGKS